jgi:hypothetical protein
MKGQCVYPWPWPVAFVLANSVGGLRLEVKEQAGIHEVLWDQVTRINSKERTGALPNAPKLHSNSDIIRQRLCVGGTGQEAIS